VGALLAANAPAHGAEPAAPAPDLAAVVAAAAAYESGASYAPLRQLEERVRTVGSETGPRRELEAGLIKLLGPGSTYEVRKFACHHLAILGTAASLPALAELLRGETTAGIACLALATHPSAQAGERLRQALPNLSGAAQLQVINTLGTRRDEAAVEALVSLAGGADAAVAQAAIVALAKIASAPARKAIAGLRRAAKPELAPALHEASLRSAESLVGLGERKEGADLYQELLGPAEPNHVRRGALAALLRLDADGGEQRIFELLARHDPILTPVAIAAVPALKSAEAVNRLARAFPSLSALEQIWLIEAMAARGDSPARNAVRAALNTEDAAVRLAAIEAVGKIDDASAVPLLRAPLDRATSSLERTTLECPGQSARGRGSRPGDPRRVQGRIPGGQAAPRHGPRPAREPRCRAGGPGRGGQHRPRNGTGSVQGIVCPGRRRGPPGRGRKARRSACRRRSSRGGGRGDGCAGKGR
jgi:HEAT repeat protein